MYCRVCGTVTGEHGFSFDHDRKMAEIEEAKRVYGWVLVWDDDEMRHGHYEWREL